MNSLSHKSRYLPHELTTKLNCVRLLRSGNSINVICRRYKISRISLWRWNKLYDGTKESLYNKSHKPLTPHPNAHTDEELTWIRNYRRRNPNDSFLEIWMKLKINKGYSRHPISLYRILRKQFGYVKKHIPKYKPQVYHTPKNIGEKWQMDTKYVPRECCVIRNSFDKRFYQYTVIDEASRKRFIYFYDEATPQKTVDFLLRAMNYFDYQPKQIQTDNGFEYRYTNRLSLKKLHPLDKVCESLGIKHTTIRPRTPRHNGKVERSHRTDNEKFYFKLKFFSLEDLRKQGAAYLKRSNNRPMFSLNFKTPLQIEENLFKHNMTAFAFS